MGPEDIERLFRKWLDRLPLPLRAKDREAGYDWQLSIWQMEVSLTQIFDRPQKGREFFEEVMRENLDLGRPHRLQLLFDRRITKAMPGSFRTRVLSAAPGPPHQPETAGIRTSEPQLWRLGRQHPESGATDRERGRSESAGIEVWRSSRRERIDTARLISIMMINGPPFSDLVPRGGELRRSTRAAYREFNGVLARKIANPTAAGGCRACNGREQTG